MDYLKLLEHSFAIEKETRECPSETNSEFLADSIFGFTTYDNEMNDLFGRKAVEVCTAINDRTTFEYQKNKENYKWYLIMCNMPFFTGKLEWGTSIRGAWWGLPLNGYFEISSCGLYDGYRQILTPLKFDKEQWSLFIKVMADFTTGKG